MKTFQQFQEESDKVTSMTKTMKGFANTIVPQLQKFANSKEASQLKNDAMNLLINKGKEALEKGSKKLGEFEKTVNK